jgi:tetratricopeptide (TPR) repeat protein
MRRIALWALTFLSLNLSGASAQLDLSGQIERLSTELKDKPNDALLWYKRGELHRAHHEYARALGDYAQAELLEPWLEPIYLARGCAFYETGRFADAYRALTQFLQMAPGNAEALRHRARTRIQLGQLHAAELDFAEALAHTKTPLPEHFLERAANLSQSSKAGAALTVLDEAIVRFGALPALEDAALAIELRAKRWVQALRRIDAMLPSTERKEHWLARKAQVLEAAGDRATASEARRAALLEIAGLPQDSRELASTKKLAQELKNALAGVDKPRK